MAHHQSAAVESCSLARSAVGLEVSERAGRPWNGFAVGANLWKSKFARRLLVNKRLGCS